MKYQAIGIALIILGLAGMISPFIPGLALVLAGFYYLNKKE